MYNRVYLSSLNYLCANNLLYEKQFGFQKQTSTEHAILQLTDDINKTLMKINLLLAYLLTCRNSIIY